MTVAHKDWELPYSRIWFAETDIEWPGLNFPILTGYILRWKIYILKYKNIAGLFSSNNIHKTVKRMSQLWQISIQLIAGLKQNVS